MNTKIQNFNEKHPIRATMLKTFASSPLVFQNTYIKGIPFEATPTMKFGTATHCKLLEGPEVFNKQYYTYEGRLTNDIKDKANGRIPIKTEEAEKIDSIIDRINNAVKSNHLPININSATNTNKENNYEVDFSWKEKFGDSKHGLDCTAKIDFIQNSEKITIIDLKVSGSAIPIKWLYTSKDMWYNIQVAHYTSAIKHSKEFDTTKPIEFLFVVVENKLPYNISIFRCTTEDDYYLMAEAARQECVSRLVNSIEADSFSQGDNIPEIIHNLYIP